MLTFNVAFTRTSRCKNVLIYLNIGHLLSSPISAATILFLMVLGFDVPKNLLQITVQQVQSWQTTLFKSKKTISSIYEPWKRTCCWEADYLGTRNGGFGINRDLLTVLSSSRPELWNRCNISCTVSKRFQRIIFYRCRMLCNNSILVKVNKDFFVFNWEQLGSKWSHGVHFLINVRSLCQCIRNAIGFSCSTIALIFIDSHVRVVDIFARPWVQSRSSW